MHTRQVAGYRGRRETVRYWSPFKGDFRISKSSFTGGHFGKQFVKPFEQIGKEVGKFWGSGMEFWRDTSDFGYNVIGKQSPREKEEGARNAANQAAAADRAAKAAFVTAEQGTMKGFAAELQRLRLKRGFASTMLSGAAGLGGGTSGGGKTLG